MSGNHTIASDVTRSRYNERQAKYAVGDCTADSCNSRQPVIMTQLTRKVNDVADELEDVLYEIVIGRSDGIKA